MADQAIETIQEEDNNSVDVLVEQEVGGAGEGEEEEVEDGRWSPGDVTPEPAKSAASNRMPSQFSKARLSRMSSSTRHDGDDLTSSDEDENEEGNSVLITELREGDIAESPQPDALSGRVPQIRLRRMRKKRVASVGETKKPEEEQEEEEEGEEWDTDLETEPQETHKDDEVEGEQETEAGRAAYLRQCEKLGVVPVSYFQRHIEEAEIVMRYHGLGPRGTHAIAKVLKENLTLERLNLTGNWMEAEGAFHMSRMLQENDYITELSLAENKLGSAGIAHVTKMLRVNSGLRKLDLSNNGFTDKDAGFLSEALEQNKFLRELNLSYNHFGSDTGEIIGPAIGGNDILDTIDLSWNQIRKKGAVSIARGLKENIRLKVINLAWNGLGPDGGAAIGDAIGVNESLQEIDISGNRIDAHAAIYIAKGLRKNEDLLILRMGNNPITTKGAIDIANALNENDNSQLTCLDLSEVPVESELLTLCDTMGQKRPLRLLHGPSLRSGNTPDDIGKPAVDPFRRDPLLVLREHIFQHDIRVLEVLGKHDADHSYSVGPDEFAESMEEIHAPLTKDQVDDLIIKLDVNNDGKVFYGDIFKRMENSAILAQEKGYMGFVAKIPNMHSRNQTILNDDTDTGTTTVNGDTDIAAVHGDTGTTAVNGDTDIATVHGDTGTTAVIGDTDSAAVNGDTGTTAVHGDTDIAAVNGDSDTTALNGTGSQQLIKSQVIGSDVAGTVSPKASSNNMMATVSPVSENVAVTSSLVTVSSPVPAASPASSKNTLPQSEHSTTQED